MNYKLLLITALITSCYCASAQVTSDTEKDKDGNYVNAQNTNAANDVGLIRVKDSIYMLKGRGGNIGVSYGKDGIFMIDDKFAENSENILNRLRSISNKPVNLLVNTHHHGDHTGGNSNMAALGTIIFSHENARERMIESLTGYSKADRKKKIDSIVNRSGDKLASEENKKDAATNAERILENAESNMKVPEGSLPIVTFPGDMTFHYNGETVKVIHLQNAHTDGDVMIYFTKSNVLHTGDAFFNGSYPFIDKDNGGSVLGYQISLDKIIQLINKDTKIIPGHGDMATLEDVKYMQSMFRYLTEKIAFEAVSKKTEAQVVAMKELTKEYDDKGFGDGFITTERFVKSIYEDVAKKYQKK